jgi:hypothetical protein
VLITARQSILYGPREHGKKYEKYPRKCKTYGNARVGKTMDPNEAANHKFTIFVVKGVD